VLAVRQGAVIIAVLVCGCGSSEPPTQTAATHYEAHCAEHLPVFGLGENSHPTKAQEAPLCACIWNQLGPWERRVSEQMFAHTDVSEFYTRAFISRFGAAVEKCGGMKL
jgi:hypothetical protein